MDDEIENLSTDELRRLYVDITGTSAPRRLGLKILKRAIYWHIQCIRNNITKKKYAIHQAGAATRLKTIGLGISEGSILLKEWRGTVYEVHRTKDGQYVYNGKEFSSLSAIAFSITGCRRSGPRFFDLTNLT